MTFECAKPQHTAGKTLESLATITINTWAQARLYFDGIEIAPKECSDFRLEGPV